MVALSEELLIEVFRPLERSDLDSLQISCRRYRTVVHNGMKRLRRLKSAVLVGKGDSDFLSTGRVPESFETHATITKVTKRELHGASLADALAFLIPLIRSSYIADYFEIDYCYITPQLADALLEVVGTLVVAKMRFSYVRFDLPSSVFNSVVLRFDEIRTLWIWGPLGAHVNNDLLEGLRRKGVRGFEATYCPCGLHGAFDDCPGKLTTDVTEDAIVDYCFGPQAAGVEGERSLEICQVDASEEFLAKVVQAAKAHPSSTNWSIQLGTTRLLKQSIPAEAFSKSCEAGRGRSRWEPCEYVIKGSDSNRRIVLSTAHTVPTHFRDDGKPYAWQVLSERFRLVFE